MSVYTGLGTRMLMAEMNSIWGERFRAGRESTLKEHSQVGNETVTVLSGA